MSEVNADDFVALPFEGVQATQAAAFDVRDFLSKGQDRCLQFVTPEMSLELR